LPTGLPCPACPQLLAHRAPSPPEQTGLRCLQRSLPTPLSHPPATGGLLRLPRLPRPVPLESGRRAGARGSLLGPPGHHQQRARARAARRPVRAEPVYWGRDSPENPVWKARGIVSQAGSSFSVPHLLPRLPGRRNLSRGSTGDGGQAVPNRSEGGGGSLGGFSAAQRESGPREVPTGRTPHASMQAMRSPGWPGSPCQYAGYAPSRLGRAESWGRGICNTQCELRPSRPPREHRQRESLYGRYCHGGRSHRSHRSEPTALL
jgi:hypothetical protein